MVLSQDDNGWVGVGRLGGGGTQFLLLKKIDKKWPQNDVKGQTFLYVGFFEEKKYVLPIRFPLGGIGRFLGARSTEGG